MMVAAKLTYGFVVVGNALSRFHVCRMHRRKIWHDTIVYFSVFHDGSVCQVHLI